MPEELSQLELEVDPWFSLSELRWAPNGRKVLIPHARQKKPEANEIEVKECVFCPDSASRNKSKPYFLSDIVQEMRNRGLYVLENMFPSVSAPEISDEIARFSRTIGLNYDRKVARGRHLVMIETPNHDLNPFSDSDATKQYYDNLVWGYIGMLKALKAEGFLWGGMGKNRNGINKDGSIAKSGSSQPHLHSQAIGVDYLLMPPWIKDTMIPYQERTTTVPEWLEYIVQQSQSIGIRIVPRWLEDIVKNSKKLDLEFKDYQGNMLLGCPVCIESRDSRFNRQIKIAADDIHVSFLDIVPEGSPYDYKISIMPYSHHGLFDEMSEREVASFATILHQTMLHINSLFGGCGYNYELRQGPWKISDYAKLNKYYNKIFHWKLDVYPASSELGNMRNQGFMSHLLGVPILKEAPEDIALRIKQQ